MKANTSTSNLTLASSPLQSKDSLTESNELLKVLSDIIADCPICLDKLLKEKNLSGVYKTPAASDRTLQNDNTQPQVSSKELNIINEL